MMEWRERIPVVPLDEGVPVYAVHLEGEKFNLTEGEEHVCLSSDLKDVKGRWKGRVWLADVSGTFAIAGLRINLDKDLGFIYACKFLSLNSHNTVLPQHLVSRWIRGAITDSNRLELAIALESWVEYMAA